MVVALWIVVGVLLLAVVAAWGLLVQFAAQQGRILMRLERLEEQLAPAEEAGACGGTADQMPEALPVGAPFPPFRLPDLQGRLVNLDDVRGRRALVVNWSPGCGFCELIAPHLAKLRRALRDHGTELLLVAAGDADANRRLAKAHRLECPILLAEAGDPVEAFRSVGTPAAYLVDEQGRVASHRALGSEEVPALAREAAGRRGGLRLRSLRESKVRRDGLPAGSRAPELGAPALEGGRVSLRELRGRRVLVVFTHPHCAPCDELAPELVRLHRELGDELAFVMVGHGDAEENRRKCEENGIQFPVVVQRGSKLSRAYGIFSWPVAFLIAEDGTIAEPVAVGVDAILALARRGARAGEEAPMRV